jgi:hypothetical protein
MLMAQATTPTYTGSAQPPEESDMTITVPGQHQPGDPGHTTDHNLIRQAILDIDAQKASVSDAVPKPLGVASAGSSPHAARADHVHQGLLGGNLLTAALANAESGWVGGYANLSYTTLNARSGTSLTIENTRASWSSAQSSWIPVVAGRTYTATAWAANVDAVNGAVGIFWANDSGGKVGDVVPTFTSTTPQRYISTGVAPTGATKAQVYLYNTASAAGQRVTYDQIGFWEGAGGDWAPPGTPITNQGIRTTHPNTDDVLCEQWDASKGRWQTTHYDSGIRRVVQTDTAGVVTVGSLPAGWVARPGIAGGLTVRRVNQRVRVEIQHLQSANAANHNDRMWTATAGFTNASTEGSLVMMNNGAKTIVISGLLGSGGGMTLAIGDFIYGGVVEYWTNDGIPTTLPGVSQTAAP